MKFLIDENLPPALAELFQSHGLAAYHINSFKRKHREMVKDHQIRRLALYNDYVIVTRDDDFVKSYVDRKVPDKMIFVFGMHTKNELLNRMDEIMDQLKQLILIYDFLEINPQEIRHPFDHDSE